MSERLLSQSFPAFSIKHLPFPPPKGLKDFPREGEKNRFRRINVLLNANHGGNLHNFFHVGKFSVMSIKSRLKSIQMSNKLKLRALSVKPKTSAKKVHRPATMIKF
jgi:hypothetical protein